MRSSCPASFIEYLNRMSGTRRMVSERVSSLTATPMLYLGLLPCPGGALRFRMPCRSRPKNDTKSRVWPDHV
eukprot:3307330-Rhodomonas_salina.1